MKTMNNAPSSQSLASGSGKFVSNYDKQPFIEVSREDENCLLGWERIFDQLQSDIARKCNDNAVIAFELYHGVHIESIVEAIKTWLKPETLLDTRDIYLPESEIRNHLEPWIGDHPIFGHLCPLQIDTLWDKAKLEEWTSKLTVREQGLSIVIGVGASVIVPDADLIVYADMARWEIQQRMRRNEISNLGLNNRHEKTSLQYKRAYFIDWRMCDRIKRQLAFNWDYHLDTNDMEQPKMISGLKLREGLALAVHRPFRVVPFFDPGVWGGQWMKEVCDLNRDAVNYAWCFDCVPEENSLLLGFGSARVEIPSINVVFYRPQQLLGNLVYQHFGAEFPIRFDFLDTMEGGNLSLQVHPLKAYIKEHFGMDYTQDESYYLLDAGDDAVVYLGFKDDVDREAFIVDVERAAAGEYSFDADKYVQKWPVKKHDHVLIPAGTIHCSGKNSMVLEISATPYIFTFKLWDWGRVDLDGKPRTISLQHGIPNLQWNRDRSWTENELVNKIRTVSEGPGWMEEQTGLHETEFIETRRHWFEQQVEHDTAGNLNVLNLIEGEEVIVESPEQAFDPMIIHFAETFIVPAEVGRYTIRPFGKSLGKRCATIKAYVRPESFT